MAVYICNNICLVSAENTLVKICDGFSMDIDRKTAQISLSKQPMTEVHVSTARGTDTWTIILCRQEPDLHAPLRKEDCQATIIQV